MKLGLEFFSANGPEGIRQIAGLGLPIFLDLKLHDIPNTVAKAVEALAPLRPAILTVHAAGGHEMMLAARRAAPAETKVVAVTLLTTRCRRSSDLVGGRRRAVASRPGCAIPVWAGLSVQARKWPRLKNGLTAFVVPGIPRPARTSPTRRSSPRQRIARWCSILVIGRPITGASDPRQAIMDIASGLDRTPAELRI